MPKALFLLPCCDISAVLMCVMLCCAMHFRAMPRYAVPCSAASRCAAPCYALLYHAKKPTCAHAATATPSTASSSTGNYLTTSGDKIVDQNGNVVNLHGIAWYGFGDPSTAMVEGLSNGYDSETQDFATVVLRMKALGFNTIKLPFSFATFDAGSTRPFPSSCSLASSVTIMGNLQEKSKPHVG